MTDEAVTPSTEQGTVTTTESEAPTDFRAYAKWRETGELPEPKEEPAVPAAAEETPQAKTEPDSEPEKTQEQEEPDDDDGAPNKRGGSRQRKIDRLTRELAEAKQLLAQREQKPAAEEPKAPAAAPAPGKPKLEDYQTLEAYQEALTDWKIDEREKQRAAQEAQRAAEEAEQKLQSEWSRRVKAAAKTHDDYDDVVDSVKAPAGPGVMAARAAMLEDEAGAEILYYLGKHPDELKRIAGLSPASAAREIGKLSAQFAQSPAPENDKPRVTGAPKPPPPSGRPSKTTSDTIESASERGDFRAYARLRRAQTEGR